MEEVEDANRLPPKLLMISRNEENMYMKQSLYSLTSNMSEKTVINPELASKDILASTHDGWFVLVDHKNNDSCLWNPTSREMIHLPKLQDLADYKQCVLSKSPMDPDCYILFISCEFIAFCLVRGDDEFVKQSFQGMVLHTLTAVSFRGTIYCHTRHGPHQFLIAHITGKTLELRPILPWKKPANVSGPTWIAIWRTYFVESIHGELLSIDEMTASPSLYDGGVLYRVYRVDLDQKECVQLDNIGEQAIFLNHYTMFTNWAGFCCPSSPGVEPNSIYCTVPNNRNLYIYDMDDRSLKVVLLPCPPLKSSQLRSYKSSQLRSCWVGNQVFQDFIRQ